VTVTASTQIRYISRESRLQDFKIRYHENIYLYFYTHFQDEMKHFRAYLCKNGMKIEERIFSETRSPAGLRFEKKCSSWSKFSNGLYLLIDLIFPIRCSLHFPFRLSPIVLIYALLSDAVRLILTGEIVRRSRCCSTSFENLAALFSKPHACRISISGDHSLRAQVQESVLLQKHGYPCSYKVSMLL